MTVKLIDSLIDKQDNSEIIRDQIAAILLANSLEQQLLAPGAGKDPEDFKLQIYTEASRPFEKWLNIGDGNDLDFSTLDKSPIVNVWFESESFDKSSSNVVDRQTSNGSFNIDVYGLGFSQSDGDAGHIPGDKAAALEAQRAMRLVRNILMAAVNTYLQLRRTDGGTVTERWTNSIEFFQPQLNEVVVQNVIAGRLSLGVRFDELAPEITPVDLDIIGLTLCRADDGRVYFDVEYNVEA